VTKLFQNASYDGTIVNDGFIIEHRMFLVRCFVTHLYHRAASSLRGVAALRAMVAG